MQVLDHRRGKYPHPHRLIHQSFSRAGGQAVFIHGIAEARFVHLQVLLAGNIAGNF